MPESLADSLAIAARGLPRELVSRGEQLRLLRRARGLAPVHCAGFEIRLAGAPGGVDLQQRITPRDAEPERFAAFLAASGRCEQAGWRRIRDFLLAWSDGELAGTVTECWLEYEPAAGLSPCVFVSFARRGGRRECMPALRRSLEILAGREEALRLAAAAWEVARRLPLGATIYDVGLMARRASALRINIGGFAPAGAAAVLAALGWDRAEQVRIGAFARAAAPFARHCKLALDWHGGLLPRAGLEIVPGGDPELAETAATRARWRGLLAWLCSKKACDADRAAALLCWPGEDEPPGCPLPWPESLVVESLARGAGEFSVMGRRLSHVKVDFVPRRPPAAKAYFGFGRLWRRAPAVAEAATSLHAAVRAAAARGAAFLRSEQPRDAPWKDFSGVQGGSEEWVGAYVAAALARNRGNESLRAARATWNWLARLRNAPGWGFGPLFSADADSTLWALRLASLLGRMRAPRARGGLAFLRRHRLRDGGVGTFLPATLGHAGQARGRRAVAGWCRAHAEVTAAAGALPGFGDRSAAWLLRAQRRDGRWQAYWYDEDAFATALAVEHLAGRRGEASLRARTRAARWAAARVARDGAVSGAGRASAFAAACCLRILLAAPPTGDMRAATRRICAWLLAAQGADGSWSGSAPLRVPLPGDPRPSASGARMGFSRDERGFFTTATAIDALGRFAETERKGRRAPAPRRNAAGASASRSGTPAPARPRRSRSRSRRR